MTQLNRSLKLTRGFRSLEEEAMLNLVRTVDRTQIAFTRLFREHGITAQQYNVLRILKGAGEPLPCLEIAERMITVVPAITGLIDRLEKAELITRERSHEDRRVVYVALSTKGGRTLRALDKPLNALHQQLLGHMSEKELKQLIKLTEKARQNAEDSA